MDHPYRCLFTSSLGIVSCFATLIFLATSTILASPQINSNETDRLALLEIKAKIVDPVGALSSWNVSNDFYELYGVTCGRRHRRVTMLSPMDLMDMTNVSTILQGIKKY